MLVPQSVEQRWGLQKNEKLILVPLKTHRIITIIKNIALAALSLLTCGLAFYLNPSLLDHIYYQLFHHRCLVKIKKDPFGIVPSMNFMKFQMALQSTGWNDHTAHLTQLVSKHRAKKLSFDARIKKMLGLFFLTIRQPHEVIRGSICPAECPELKSEKSQLHDMNYGYALSPGVKSIMEDLVMADSIQITVGGVTESINSFIVMDGHGIQKGQEPINVFAKKYFLHHLRTYLNAYLKDGFDLCGVYEAFKSSFHEINENFPYQRSGTTFLGIFFINHIMFCISIGDSRAFLVDPFLKVPIALAADPNHPYFANKLAKLKAKVMSCGEVTRVEGMLNMSTALGDKHITNTEGKKVIKPSMSFIAIPQMWIQSPAYIVMGSDGVFDYLDDQHIEEIVRRQSCLETKARDLVTQAFSLGSKDNLSSLVIKI